MKTRLLTIAFLFYCVGIFAQQNVNSSVKLKPVKSNSSSVNRAHKPIKKTIGADDQTVLVTNAVSRNLPAPASSRNVVTTYDANRTMSEAIIGTSTYDLQTNGTISNRIVNNVDGTIGAVWTMSQDPGGTSGGYPDRGTGYNYLDAGGNWGPQPSTRVEPNRTGFTNIGYAGNYEAILCHDPTLTGEPFSSRATKGIGTWNTTYISGTSITTLWPKMAAGGPTGHSFHAILNSTNSTGPFWYMRSTDDGVTWSTPAELPLYLAGIDYTAVGADAYSIDVRGSTVAIVSGDLAQDLVLLKSTDDGVTWTKTIVYQFPIPLYNGATMNTDTNMDGTADTLFSNASDATVVLDNYNTAQVFFGGTRVYEAPGGTGLSYFFPQGIYYWNENMTPNTRRLIATPPDRNGDGVLTVPAGCGNDTSQNPVGYYGTGLVSYIEMPSAGVDANNNYYLSYQAIDELSDTSIYYEDFVHPYIIKSTDFGNTWTDPDSAYDVVLTEQGAAGESLDGAFCAMAKRVDTHIHVVYQRDFAPGTTLSGANFPCESGNNNGSSNDIIYASIDVNAVRVGIQTTAATIPVFNLSANYPNPFTGKTSFDIGLRRASDVIVEVSDLLGRVLTLNTYANLTTGVHTLSIDATKFAAGVYTYKVKAGNETVTKKMIVQ